MKPKQLETFLAVGLVIGLACVTGWLLVKQQKTRAALASKTVADEKANEAETNQLEILYTSDLFLAQGLLRSEETNSHFVAQIDAAVKRWPTNATFWCARAAVAHRIGDRDRALEQFTRAIELASENNDTKLFKDALVRRSIVLRELGRFGKFGQDQRRAVGLPWEQADSNNVLPDFHDATEVSIELGQTNREAGLYFLSGVDSRHTLAVTNGEEAEFFAAGFNYAYFFIDPTFKWKLGSNVLIHVEYQLVKGKPIGLHYDGAPGAYETASKTVRRPRGNWQVIEFIMSNARFSNRQNLHADFRVYDNERGFYLKRVTVLPLEPIDLETLRRP